MHTLSTHLEEDTQHGETVLEGQGRDQVSVLRLVVHQVELSRVAGEAGKDAMKLDAANFEDLKIGLRLET